jgi:galactokinase
VKYVETSVRPTYTNDDPIRSIIGEHIDYALFGVLPAAIENDLIIAIARNETPAVTIDNLGREYTRTSFEAQPNAGVWDLPIDADLHWSGYVKAGYLVCALKPLQG